jgi:hypothetical protein
VLLDDLALRAPTSEPVPEARSMIVVHSPWVKSG